MTRLDESRSVFLAILLSFPFRGAHGALLVSPAGPTDVDALSGTNVTLAVSFSGPTDPLVAWFVSDLPVVTWTINSSTPPVVAENRRDVLRMEPNGSLSLVNVPLGYTGNYTVEMTKSGLKKSSSSFSLRVFEIIQNVSLAQPDAAVEGAELLSLQYDMGKGVVERQTWFFDGAEISTDPRYSLEERSLVIRGPNRNDTGRYSVLLTNPFSSVTAHMDLTLLYGPDEPVLEARPAQSFYVSGDSLSVSCRADGVPQPTVRWLFGGQTLSDSHGGVLNLTDIQTSQGGLYTCMVLNERTAEERRKDIVLDIYERPLGNPVCSVHFVNDVQLQYSCQWLGGAPQAQLSFPALNTSSSGAGNFSLTVAASENLDGKTLRCVAHHPLEQNGCNVTASSPVSFQPVLSSADSEGKIVVTIDCVSEASPDAVVSWFKGSEAVPSEAAGSGTTYHVSSNTTQLKIHDYNASYPQNFTCTSHNPLGSQRRDIHLIGPSISNYSLLPNEEGTIVRLTWDVPSTSVVTGFDIQMKGPNLLSTSDRNGTQLRGSYNKFRSIQHKNGSARRAFVSDLNPTLTYRFRVVPKASTTEGEPSEVHRVGPGEGLSGPAIAGIAAGIPCSLLFLLLLAGLIYLCVYCCKNRNRQTRYPMSRAVEKAITTQTDSTPHNLLTGGLKSLPDYNRLQLTPSERSVTPPTFVPSPPVKLATIV